MQRAEEDGVLGEEAGQGRNAGQRGGADHERAPGGRHLVAQAAHLADVQFAVGGVHDAAGAQEEQGLVEGVGEKQEHGRTVCAHADAHHHEAELRNGRVGRESS